MELTEMTAYKVMQLLITDVDDGTVPGIVVYSSILRYSNIKQ